jgi:hypothetical protein
MKREREEAVDIESEESYDQSQDRAELGGNKILL